MLSTRPGLQRPNRKAYSWWMALQLAGNLPVMAERSMPGARKLAKMRKRSHRPSTCRSTLLIVHVFHFCSSLELQRPRRPDTDLSVIANVLAQQHCCSQSVWRLYFSTLENKFRYTIHKTSAKPHPSPNNLKVRLRERRVRLVGIRSTMRKNIPVSIGSAQYQA